MMVVLVTDYALCNAYQQADLERRVCSRRPASGVRILLDICFQFHVVDNKFEYDEYELKCDHGG